MLLPGVIRILFAANWSPALPGVYESHSRPPVLENGAHHVVDHRAPDYLEKVMALTGGRGVDVILEMLANVNLGKDLPLLAKHGRVIVIGSRGKVEITPRDLMSRDADVRAMTLFNATPAELADIHAALATGLEKTARCALSSAVRCRWPTRPRRTSPCWSPGPAARSS